MTTATQVRSSSNRRRRHQAPRTLRNGTRDPGAAFLLLTEMCRQRPSQPDDTAGVLSADEMLPPLGTPGLLVGHLGPYMDL